MKTLNHKRIAVAAFTLGAAIASAHASELQILPGSICKPEVGSDPSDYFYASGGIKRAKVYAPGEVPSQTEYVHCAIPRDTNSPGIRLLHVRFSKATRQVPMFCILSALRADGSPQSSQVSMVPASAVGTRLTGFSRPPNVRGSRALLLSCNLPGKDINYGGASAIHSIAFEQF